jgi:hypothetical protein
VIFKIDEKNHFGAFDEAWFEGVERPYEFIFCILYMKKAVE